MLSHHQPPPPPDAFILQSWGSAHQTLSLFSFPSPVSRCLLCLHESDSSGDLTEADHAASVSCSLPHLAQCLQGSSQQWPVSVRTALLLKAGLPSLCGWTTPRCSAFLSLLMDTCVASIFGCGWFRLLAFCETSAGGNGRLL